MIRSLTKLFLHWVNRINSILHGPSWVVARVEDSDGLQTSEWWVVPKAKVPETIKLLRDRSEVTSYLAAPIRIGTEPHWLEGRE